ncbi:MAG TPA: MMPL family transporter, partial [Capillimicrobium sp.]
MTRIAAAVTARPRRVLVATALCFLVAAVYGAPAPGLLDGGRAFEDGRSEAAVARERLESATGRATGPGLIALIDAGTPVEAPEARRRVAAVAAIAEADPAVATVSTHDRPGGAAQVSRDGRSAYVAVTFRALPEAELEDAAGRLADALHGVDGVRVGGRQLMSAVVPEQVAKDLARAEAIAFPIILALSFLFFRGLVAALMPLLV